MLKEKDKEIKGLKRELELEFKGISSYLSCASTL